MVLRLWVGERHKGPAPLVTDVSVAYEAHQGVIYPTAHYTDNDESVEMRTLNSLAPRREAITTISITRCIWYDPTPGVKPGTSHPLGVRSTTVDIVLSLLWFLFVKLFFSDGIL